jgi:hypothetical protein
MLLLSVPHALAGPSPRETVNFDFAWRFQRAAEPRYQQCEFEEGVNYGSGQIWAGATASKEECCNACANHETCRAWAWDGRECVVRDNSAASSVEVTCAAGTKLGGGSLYVANMSNVKDAVRWCKGSARCAGFTAQTQSCSSISGDNEQTGLQQYDFHDSWGVQHKSASPGWASWIVPRPPPPGHWSGRLGAPWPENATSPARADLNYDDSAWEVVDAPHDFGRTRMLHCQATGRRRRLESDSLSSGPSGELDFANNCSGWYRKHFSLPSEWRQGVTWVYFEGVHHYSVVWLNGKRLGTRHINGYTSFWHRLDNNGARFGDKDADRNVLAVFANSAPGSGMYGYHGGGLTRHQFLAHTHSDAFIPPDSAWVYTNFGPNSSIQALGSTPAEGLTVNGTTIVAKGTIRNARTQLAHNDVWVAAEFIIEGGRAEIIASQAVGPFAVSVNGTSTFQIRVSPSKAVQLWSVARPVLHTARITVHVGGPDGPAVDSYNVTFGVRDVHFDADRGFFLNKQHVKMRGFCDFGPFGAVGAATPDRIHLYRAQTLRSVGTNAWRMAHNPPAPGRLDVMDRLGMLALDENHYYGDHGYPYGTYSPETLQQTVVDMGDLVRRDRSHPSIFAWNLCNEVMCKDDPATARAMRNATNIHDGTRPITMNHIVTAQGALPYLDVQGMSHRSGSHMDSFHIANPKKPILSTEAAICKTERGVDYDYCPRPQSLTHEPNATCLYNNELAGCIATAVNFSDSRGFNAGTFLWAGFDHGSGPSGASGLIADWAGIKKPMRCVTPRLNCLSHLLLQRECGAPSS